MQLKLVVGIFIGRDNRRKRMRRNKKEARKKARKSRRMARDRWTKPILSQLKVYRP